MSLDRRLISEWLGTFSLLATVLGSGIMAERLAGGNIAIALFGNTIPTWAIHVVLITVFGGIVGVLATHVVFEHPIIDPSTTARSGVGHMFLSLAAE